MVRQRKLGSPAWAARGIKPTSATRPNQAILDGEGNIESVHSSAQFGSVTPNASARAALEGAAPFGDFGRGASFGFQLVARGGVELIIGPGIYIAPDGEINFARLGASADAEAAGLSSLILAGFMLGGRFGYDFNDFVT